MEVNITGSLIERDPLASELIDFLSQRVDELSLEEAELYYDFPILKDLEGAVIRSRILLVSRRHGVISIDISDAGSRQTKVSTEELEETNNKLDQTYSLLYSRFIRNSNLRRRRGELIIPLEGLLVTPFIKPDEIDLSFEVYDFTKLAQYIRQNTHDPLSTSVYMDLIATIDGSRGIVHPRVRQITKLDTHSKGFVANKIEAEINIFDQQQKHGAIRVLDGVQRIRGLAGSGKTVVLTMKAAQMHLREPDARILYTFYTRSLYQQIKRLITRFYRQFDDKDPDWSRINILHAWGGKSIEGVYSNACFAHEVPPLSFSEASHMPGKDQFDIVCADLLKKVSISPMYDYIFVDEGQDFPPSFLRLCIKLSEKQRVVYAYDDLQTIWQKRAPTPADIGGVDEGGKSRIKLTDDIVLFKCYRNPRELLVCAHALGFGIYGDQIVQMLQNKAHWEDIGYIVREGTFKAGSSTIIERPAENSLKTISEEYKPDEIVEATVYDKFDDEIEGVARQIKDDISDGLRPDDILVEVVDDRAARTYLSHLSSALAQYEIKTNNIHSDVYGIKDFYKEDHVTLSTVHKAKGNEAFIVYVIGVDALFASWAGPRERNMLFTAMTRAKGWVRISGMGENAAICMDEIKQALQNFPNLCFTYPSEDALRVMKRDLAQKAIQKLEAERALERALGHMTPEEIMRFVKQRSVTKGKRTIIKRRKKK